MKPQPGNAGLRRAAELAEHRCLAERGAFVCAFARLRARGERHAPRWLLGGGFACGIVAAWLPLRALLRTARFAMDATLFVRRLPIPLAAADPGEQERPA